MKKLSQFVVEAKAIDVQDDAMNFIPSPKLKQYLTIADKFISVEAKEIINWLIANNGTYMKEIGSLQDFYGKGKPKDKNLQDLYKWIGILNKKNRLLEVPTFMSEDQFNAIISKEISPDEILLDLRTKRGRNAVAKKYTPLVWKIARGFNGKSGLTLDELFSAGMEGLTYAMDGYGKSAEETQKKRMKNKSAEEIAELVSDENNKKRKSYTFLQYAAYLIRIVILEAIKNESRVVRVPVSVQNKERKETGRNTKNNTVSGDEPIGGEDGDKKGIFGKIDSKDDADANLDKEDIEKLWKGIIKMLEKEFSEKQLDIFYSMNGLFGHEKLKGKEIMAKYKLKNPSEISNSNWKVLNYIKTNKTLKKAFAELYSLYKECLNDEDNRNGDPSVFRVTEHNTSYTE